MRAWERGTEAHATVAAGGDQFRVWGAFRSGPLPVVRLLEADDDHLVGEALLPGGIRFRRALTLGARSLVIEDSLEGRGSTQVVSSIPLAVGASVEVTPADGPFDVEARTIAERFGERTEATALVQRTQRHVAVAGRLDGRVGRRARAVILAAWRRPDMEQRIRVLRLIARLNVGGPALHVSYLTRGLADRGYDTTLVAGQVGAAEGSMEYAARDLGVEPLFLPMLQRDIDAGHDVGAVLRVRDLIRTLRPDILHTHTAKAGAVGRLAAAIARVPDPPVIVHTFHGHVLRGYFGPAKTFAFRETERSLARRTDRLIAVSPEVRDELVAQRIAPFEKFAVVRLGLDLDKRATADPVEAAALRARLGVGDRGAADRLARADDRDQAGRRAARRVRRPARTGGGCASRPGR